MSNIKVAVRIRPLNAKEIAKGEKAVIYKQIVQNQQQVVIGTTNKAFAFNHVFDQDEDQQQIYDKTAAHMVEKLFKGYNATILAYGQTGSGKTYTMGTACNGSENSRIVGIVPRAVEHIFDKISEMQDHYVQVSCSFFEIYNEVIYDLLSDEARDKSVRELLDKNVNKLTEKQVLSPKECMTELMRGSAQRTTGATSMNKQSSRSHAIFSITLRVIPKGDEGNETTSHFLLVDLAGSERCKKTNAEGERFKEGVNINMGLFVLGNVITSLCEQKSHIPYRNSILTRILQDSLGGNSITLMIACVGPADDNMEESHNTLRYANSAKNIRNKPVVNMDPAQAELKQLRAEVNQLRLQLLGKAPIGNQDFAGRVELDSKIQQLQEQVIESARELAKWKTNYTNLELGATLSEQVLETLRTNIMQLRDCVMKYFSDKPEATEVLEELKQTFKSIDEVMQRYRVDKGLTLFNDADYETHADVRKQLENIREHLTVKEELLNRLEHQNDLNATFVVEKEANDYIELIDELKKELEILREKEKLRSDKPNKQTNESRTKIQTLEKRLDETEKKLKMTQKLLEQRKDEAAKMKRLASEIQEMRAAKVKLIKKMKEDSNRLRQCEATYKKEVNKLEIEKKKQLADMKQKEAMHQKQQTVLKRKMEEAIATRKRLEKALENQRAIKKQKDAKSVNAVKILEHEMDVIHSVIDARHSVKQLTEDRALLNLRMEELKKCDDANPEEIKNLQQQIELRTAQIQDFQNQVIATDIDGKIKELCDRMQTTSDLKAVFRTMVKNSVTSRQQSVEFQNQMDDLKAHTEMIEEENASLKEQLSRAQHDAEINMIQMRNEFEEKMITWLTWQNSTEPAKVTGDSHQSFNSASRQMSDMMNELIKYRERVKELEDQLAEVSTGANASGATKKIKKESKPSEVVDLDELFSDQDTDSDGDETEQSDPEWRLTPLGKRTKKSLSVLRRSFVEPMPPPLARKRISETNTCGCKAGGCKNRQCSCIKRGGFCSEACKCNKETCQNVDTITISNAISKLSTADNHSNAENANPNVTYSMYTPKKSIREEIDVTTPLYSHKKRKPFFDFE